MDGYTVGLLLKTLLASAGLKATVVLVIVGGTLYGIFRAIRGLATFLEKLLASRDAIMSETMRRIAEQDRDRAEFQAEIVKVLERINGTTDATLKETQTIRTEIHARLNKMQEDVTTIKGAVS